LSQRTWAQAIENSFEAKPQSCPDCFKKNPLTPLRKGDAAANSRLLVSCTKDNGNIKSDTYLSEWIFQTQSSSSINNFELLFLNFESY
jgi:hypothetical protein